MSRYTELVLKNVLRRTKKLLGTPNSRYKLWFATKSSTGHQRVEAHRNTPQKRTGRVEKPPGTLKTELKTMICDKFFSWASTWRGTLKQSPKTFSARRKTPSYSQNRATNYELRQNLLLSISVLRYTEIVFKNGLSESKNPQLQSKPRHRLWFPPKSAPGHQPVKAHRNSPQKSSERAEKPPGTGQNRATHYDLRQNLLLGISVSRYTKIVLQNLLSGQKTHVHSKPRNRLWFAIVFSWASAYRGTPK